VRFSPRSVAIAACLVLPVAVCAQLFGQAGPPVGGPARPAAPAASAGTSVVVIDVAFIYKNHNRFNQTMLDIKSDIEKFEAYVRKKQTDFKSLGEALGTFNAGSPEYKQKEEELARLQSDLQVEVGLKRKEFLQQEARVYFRVYKEIEAEVKNFSERNGINLVLRYNRDEMKEDDRQSVLAGVNRAVVYQQGRDITELVLKALNQGPVIPATSPAAGAGGPERNAVRPGPVLPRPTNGTTVPR
jgi:Skp family chaperone for outer membrane proteins